MSCIRRSAAGPCRHRRIFQAQAERVAAVLNRCIQPAGRPRSVRGDDDRPMRDGHRPSGRPTACTMNVGGTFASTTMSFSSESSLACPEDALDTAASRNPAGWTMHPLHPAVTSCARMPCSTRPPHGRRPRSRSAPNRYADPDVSARPAHFSARPHCPLRILQCHRHGRNVAAVAFAVPVWSRPGTRYFSSAQVMPCAVSQSQISLPSRSIASTL